MKVPSVVAWLMAALLCGVALAAGGDSSQIRWAPDLVSAREASVKFKVPLLIHFYGDACLPCKTLEQRVYSQAEVIGTLNKYFICVAINANRQPAVASEFAVHSWPTDVFMSPDGEILFRGVCPQDARTYMGILNSVAVMNRDRNIMLSSQNQASANALAQQAVAPGAPARTASGPATTASPDSVSAQSPAGLPAPQWTQHSITDQHHYYGSSPENEQHHQLGKGLAGQASVQSGPLVPSIQPTTIHGATHASAQPAIPVSRQSLSENASAFPPLPGLEPTRVIRDGGNGANYLAGMAEIPQLGESVMGQGIIGSDTKIAGQLTSAVKVSQSQDLWISSDANASSDTDTLDDEWTDILAVQEDDLSSGAGDFKPTEQVEQLPTRSEPVVTPPALDGFCPVELRQQRWTTGQEQFSVQHLGKVYHLSSQASVDEFLRSPDAYAPVLSGCDPMLLLNHGKLVPGSTRHGLFEGHTGQVLLFSSAESKLEFQRNFDKNMQALQAVTRRASTSLSR